MTNELVFYLMVFLVVGVFFLFFHLMLGRLIRPVRPDPDKLTIYECGEPTVGSAWVQFDLRYYVVALLFVIFDVEVVFFFPWAVVFGKANTLANENLPEWERKTLSAELSPKYLPATPGTTPKDEAKPIDASTAGKLAWLAFWDILVFFGVLLVGFAYLWKRGDINWVRSIAAERAAEPQPDGAQVGGRAEEQVLVGAGHGS
jgi:NADH-quinone oxidoreductase subunit A